MKRMRFNNKLILLIPAFWACLVDLIVTSLNQPETYWRGDLNAAAEGNPLVYGFMENSVFGIFIFTLLWLIVIIVISYFLTPKICRIFALFALMGHTWGAATWIGFYYGFWYILLFILFNSVLFIFMEDIFTTRNNVQNETTACQKHESLK